MTFVDLCPRGGAGVLKWPHGPRGFVLVYLCCRYLPPFHTKKAFIRDGILSEENGNPRTKAVTFKEFTTYYFRKPRLEGYMLW